MAWFGTNRNKGVKAYSPWSVDPDEVKYTVAASHSSKTYVAESEQVFQYKGAPTIYQESYDKHDPRKIGLLREEPHIGPWSSAHDKKADEFSPRAQVGHRSWNMADDHGPKKGDEFSPKAHVGHEPWSAAHDHGPKKGDGFSPKAQLGHQPWSAAHDHGPKKGDEFSPRAHAGHQPWSTTHDHGPKKGEGLSPKARVQVGHNPNKGSPRGTHVPPPSRDHYDSPHRDHGKYNNLSDESDDNDYGHVSDDDDVVCEDGVCYRKGSKPKSNNNHLLRQDYNRDKERTKLGNSYSPPTSYTSAPKKDLYHEKTYPKDNHNDPKLHKGNDNNIPPYKVPTITTSPKNDHAQYQQTNNTHHPPPIKTRIDTRKAMDLRKDYSPRDSSRSGAVPQPQYGSPRKEYQGRTETIDSGEARRKYATASPRGGVNVEEKYTGTIDSITAARKYKGVFVPNW